MLSTQADYSSVHVDFQTAFTSVGTRFDTVLSLLEQFATTVGSSVLRYRGCKSRLLSNMLAVNDAVSWIQHWTVTGIN